MLRPRIIPCLLVHNGGLVKTVGFSAPKYVGDPINAVRIFNDKGVDELMVLDIDASSRRREPDYQLISHLAGECRMPLCYGGGVKSVVQFERIIALGVEKVAISSAAVEQPSLIADAAKRVGRQSVVVVIDARASAASGRHEVTTHNGTHSTGIEPAEFAARMQDAGAGEIVLNSVDRDGTMKGYDSALIDAVRRAVTVPVTAIGGAGSLDDLRSLIARYGIIGAAAGSLFVFKGKYRAVLINYPSGADKDALGNAGADAR